MSQAEERRAAIERAKEVMRAYQDSLMAKANVIGVGVGFVEREGERTRDVGVVVMVGQKVALSQLAEVDRIPQELDGVPIDVQSVGELGPH